jgi:hypothetical protein
VAGELSFRLKCVEIPHPRRALTWLESYEAGLTQRERNLLTTLAGLVPRFVLEMRDWTFEQRRAAVDREALLMCDTLLYGRGDGRPSTKADHAASAKSLNALARGLAVLSFQPGGVTFAGRHWCADPRCRCPDRPCAVCEAACGGTGTA